VAIDNLKRTVWQLANHQSVHKPDLGQDPAEGVLLRFGMLAPILGMWPDVAGAKVMKFLDAIANLHGGSVPEGSRRPTRC